MRSEEAIELRSNVADGTGATQEGFMEYLNSEHLRKQFWPGI
jgi:hypothetical protein